MARFINKKTPYLITGGRSWHYAAIPPPALSGSGSRVEILWISSQPGNTRLPVQVHYFAKEYIPVYENVKLSWKISIII
jgi:hypothetical protein